MYKADLLNCIKCFTVVRKIPPIISCVARSGGVIDEYNNEEHPQDEDDSESMMTHRMMKTKASPKDTTLKTYGNRQEKNEFCEKDYWCIGFCQKKEIICYKFKKASHYANQCENDDETMKTSNKKGLEFPST